MSRVLAVVACGFTVAACSAIPSLDFLKSSPPTAALRFEIRTAGRRGQGLWADMSHAV